MPKKIHRESSAYIGRKSGKIESKVLGKTGERDENDSNYENFKDGTSYTHTNNVKSIKIYNKLKETASQDNLNSIHELQRDFSKKTL